MPKRLGLHHFVKISRKCEHTVQGPTRAVSSRPEHAARPRVTRQLATSPALPHTPTHTRLVTPLANPYLSSARPKKVTRQQKVGTELTRVSHESALNPRQSVALCIFEVYLQSSVSSMCLRRDTLERYTRRCTLIVKIHTSHLKDTLVYGHSS